MKVLLDGDFKLETHLNEIKSRYVAEINSLYNVERNDLKTKDAFLLEEYIERKHFFGISGVKNYKINKILDKIIKELEVEKKFKKRKDVIEKLEENIKSFSDKKAKSNMNLVESTKDIVHCALRQAEKISLVRKGNTNIKSLESADTIVLGDVHATLDLLVQNLYFAGVVDNHGNYRVDSKKGNLAWRYD